MTDISTSEKANHRFKLVAGPDAPQLARTLLSSVLIYWRLGHLVEDGKVVVSELVSNAAAAAPGREIWLGVDREEPRFASASGIRATRS
ncbi:hypothetical protein [Actinomadura sp. HBU206391]|uniref:hypothetical protein n=1 Tax=Actinomadura sp. HBU206391 TaxID=2731692 RepID=UPI00164FF9F3|nr:hypothetical protein [Actinomadura sp. HBU206391]MBC6460736.1 hypothetical protein [Actinomadura sp. HBU206391]